MKNFMFFLLLTVGWLNTNKVVGQTLTFHANISGGYSETSWVGHIWIEYGTQKGTAKYGFYPTGLEGEGNRRPDVSYTFHIDQRSLTRVNDVIIEYSQKWYVIGVRDCRSFAYHVASSAGLNVPSIGTKSPAQWLGELVDLN